MTPSSKISHHRPSSYPPPSPHLLPPPFPFPFPFPFPPMATISSPRFHSPTSSSNPNPTKLSTSTRFLSLPRRAPPRFLQSTLCRCQTSGADDPGSKRRSWDAVLQDAVKAAVGWWEDYVASWRSSEEVESVGEGAEVGVKVEWDWDRWKKHFEEVEVQERIVSVLRSQLNDAVHREDYKDAAKLQRAIVAAVTNDVVGSAIKHLTRAIDEEQYGDAANIRDNAGTGLIGWWSGISEDSSDPHGRIIRITAEHGRYVARSFSCRQLASGRPGFPLFEIYFTVGDDGKYRNQAVYLKRNSGNSGSYSKKLPEAVDIDNSGPLSDSTKEKKDLSDEEGVDTEESDNDSDIADGLDGIQNVLQDMIPGVKVKVLKVVSPGKVDRDLISKVIEQIMEEEDDDKDVELESIEADDGIKTESDSEEMVVDNGDATIETTEDQSDLSVKFVVSGLTQNLSVDIPPKDLVRMPARLETRGRFSFSFSLVTEGSQKELGEKGHDFPDKVTQPPTTRSADLIMSDLAKVIYSRKRIPLKVLKDVGELINLTVNQDQNQPPLHGKMCFNRIDIPTTSDPLSGLYISARGMFSSEVLYLRRKIGQWQEDGKNKEAVDLEFYEYVEALKLTGDPSVPAGQVAFRAKVGKRNQLPHKGIIPEEFGVVARYKGQGRLAEPGFQNPRWVDGELVILDGKYIREGPVIGFVYWAPEYHFLMFFNRLRLQN